MLSYMKKLLCLAFLGFGIASADANPDFNRGVAHAHLQVVAAKEAIKEDLQKLEEAEDNDPDLVKKLHADEKALDAALKVWMST